MYNPEGLPDYKVPPPIQLDPSTTHAAPSMVPEKDSETEEDVFDDKGENEMDNAELVEDDEISSDGLDLRSFQSVTVYLVFM